MRYVFSNETFFDNVRKSLPSAVLRNVLIQTMSNPRRSVDIGPRKSFGQVILIQIRVWQRRRIGFTLGMPFKNLFIKYAQYEKELGRYIDAACAISNNVMTKRTSRRRTSHLERGVRVNRNQSYITDLEFIPVFSTSLDYGLDQTGG